MLLRLNFFFILAPARHPIISCKNFYYRGYIFHVRKNSFLNKIYGGFGAIRKDAFYSSFKEENNRKHMWCLLRFNIFRQRKGRLIVSIK